MDSTIANNEPKVTQAQVGVKYVQVMGHTVMLDGDYDGEYIISHFHLRVYTVQNPHTGKVYGHYVYASRKGSNHSKFNSPRRTTLARQLLGVPPIEVHRPIVSYRDGNTLNLTTTNLYWRSLSDAAKGRDPIAYVRQKSKVKRRKTNPELQRWRGVNYAGQWGRNIYPRKYMAMASKVYLGQFDSPEDAARAYDEYAYSRYGKAAILNYPEDYGLTQDANGMLHS
jgi:hypothetical protein